MNPTTLLFLDSYFNSSSGPPSRYAESMGLTPCIDPHHQAEPTDRMLLTVRLQRQIHDRLKQMDQNLRRVIETHFQPRGHTRPIQVAFISPNLARALAPRKPNQTKDDALQALLSRPEEAKAINTQTFELLSQAIEDFDNTQPGTE